MRCSCPSALARASRSAATEIATNSSPISAPATLALAVKKSRMLDETTWVILAAATNGQAPAKYHRERVEPGCVVDVRPDLLGHRTHPHSGRPCAVRRWCPHHWADDNPSGSASRRHYAASVASASWPMSLGMRR